MSTEIYFDNSLAYCSRPFLQNENVWEHHRYSIDYYIPDPVWGRGKLIISFRPINLKNNLTTFLVLWLQVKSIICFYFTAHLTFSILRKVEWKKVNIIPSKIWGEFACSPILKVIKIIEFNSISKHFIELWIVGFCFAVCRCSTLAPSIRLKKEIRFVQVGSCFPRFIHSASFNQGKCQHRINNVTYQQLLG